jgi:Vacuolar sorting-associated protein 13, extended-chorein
MVFQDSKPKPDHNFILSPICGSLKMLVNKSKKPSMSIPKHSLSFLFDAIHFELQQNQVCTCVCMCFECECVLWVYACTCLVFVVCTLLYSWLSPSTLHVGHVETHHIPFSFSLHPSLSLSIVS